MLTTAYIDIFNEVTESLISKNILLSLRVPFDISFILYAHINVLIVYTENII